MRPRFFKVRSKKEIDDEMLSWLRRGFDEWRSRVHAQIAEWQANPANGGTPVPQYEIGELVLSADRKNVSVKISGDPLSYVAFKTFEDGVPAMIYSHIPRDRRPELEKRYINPDHDYGGWIPVK